MICHPKRILIVGGGPCGLVTLRNCLDRGDVDDVQLVERRDDVGGVWNQADLTSESADNTSNMCASYAGEEPTDDRPQWRSPAYSGMIGNVLTEFLTFSGNPFPTPPRPNQPFPTLLETHQYLKEFAQPLLAQGRIRLNHEVVGVEEISKEGNGWRVIMKDWSQGGSLKEERWEAVVIATVWFDNPYFAPAEGLDVIMKAGKARHAISWTGPDEYDKKRVVVIGNANSANEMAAQLVDVAQLPVYRSTRRVSIFPSLPDKRIHDVGPVLRYEHHPSDAGDKITVHVKDHVIQDVDYILFGTGYYPDVPYLRVLEKHEPLVEGASPQFIPLTGRIIQPCRVPSLFRQILYAYNPTLAFIGATVSFTPFAFADLTSTWLALAWSGQIEIPDTIQERLTDEENRLDMLHRLRCETDNPSDLVSFHFLAQYELPYAKVARGEIIQAVPELDSVLAKWDDEQDSRRFSMYATKLESLYYLGGKKPED